MIDPLLASVAGVIAGFLFGTAAAWQVWKNARRAAPKPLQDRSWLACADEMPPLRTRVIACKGDKVWTDVYWGQGSHITTHPHPESWKVECWRWVVSDRPLAPNHQPTHWQHIPTPFEDQA